jgi:hypothetical protein
MIELKFRDNAAGKASDALPQSCGCSGGPPAAGASGLQRAARKPEWVTGTVQSRIGDIRQISTGLSSADHWEHIKCRISAFRNSYTIEPGLYAVGRPDETSEVLVSANYKMSFDLLRKALNGMNAWVIVLDTGGINVWCAAGKGTFGTKELVRRIRSVSLEKIVDHRRLILPQLSAPGVSAHIVTRETGFRPVFGPVYAHDIPAFVRAGHKTSPEMRRITFSAFDRLVLTPMELKPALKYFPHFALLLLLVFGLQPSGILFREAVSGSLPFLALGIISILAGALLTPVMLPFIPFRSFSLKGLLVGLAAVGGFLGLYGMPDIGHWPLLVFAWGFFPAASSFIALQFTGSTTFTGPSGVRKELRIGMPLYLAAAVVSCLSLIAHKLIEWRII